LPVSGASILWPQTLTDSRAGVDPSLRRREMDAAQRRPLQARRRRARACVGWADSTMPAASGQEKRQSGWAVAREWSARRAGA